MVSDFGIARAVSDSSDSRLTATGMAIGTPAYMSPEQAAGERDIDGRSDLYALGVVAYQMLTGTTPFTAPSTPAMLVKHLTERPQPVRARRSDVPEELERIVMVLLEKDPNNRLPSAQALVAALDGAPVHVAARSEPVPAPPMSLQRPSPAFPPLAEHTGGMAMARWSEPEVVGFRRKFKRWATASGIFVFIALLTDFPGLMIASFWGAGLAWQFSGLVGKGYSWRDVMRQPADKQLVDVLGEAVESVQTVFDGQKRELRRIARAESRDARALPSGGTSMSRSPYPAAGRGSPVPVASEAAPTPGSPAAVLAQAQIDRDEIKRLIDSLSGPDRNMVASVVPSADQVLDRVRVLAASLA